MGGGAGRSAERGSRVLAPKTPGVLDPIIDEESAYSDGSTVSELGNGLPALRAFS